MLSISVIVPVRNEAASIETTLRMLLTQHYPEHSYEVIVADGVSTDDTVPIVRRLQGEFEQLKLVFNPARWSSAGRNTAIRHAVGDAIVVVDGHCGVPDRDYLANLAEAFETSGAMTLGRPQPLEAPNPTPFQEAVSAARSSRLGHNPDSDIYSDQAKFVRPQSTAVAYRREVFARIGLFDQSFDACEDVELNQRVDDAGFSCYFTPTIKIEYHPRRTWLALVTQLGRYGCGRARLALKNPKSLTLPALVPPLWFAGVVLGFVAALLSTYLAIAYVAVLAVYLVAILGVSAKLARTMRATAALRLPLVFVGIHLGFALGFLGEAKRRALRLSR